MASTALIRKLTPVLGVERIEPVIPFWNKLGLIPTTEVPDMKANDRRLAFAIFGADGVEIMYQTIASLADDLLNAASDKAAFPLGPQKTVLFVEVKHLAEVEARLQGERLIMPRRTTFYGSIEAGYADPAGNVIIFAEHQANAQ